MSKEYYTNFHEDNTSMDSNDMNLSSNKHIPMVVKKQNGKVCVVVSDDMINSTDDLAGLLKALKSKHEPNVESTVDIDAVDYPHDGSGYHNMIAASHQNMSSKIKFHNYNVSQKFNYKNEDDKFIEDAMHYSETQEFSNNKYQIKYLSNTNETVKRGRGRPPKMDKNEKRYDSIDEDTEADDDSKLNSTIEKYLSWDSIQSRIKYSIKSPLQSINQTIHTTSNNNNNNNNDNYYHHQVINSETPVKVVTSPFKYSSTSSTYPTDSTNQSMSKIIKPVTIKFPYSTITNNNSNNSHHQIPIKSVPSIIQLKTNDSNSNLPQKRLIMTKSNTSNDNNANTITKLSLISNSSGYKVAAYRLPQMKPPQTPPQLDNSIDEPPSPDNIDRSTTKRGRGRPRKYPLVASNKKHIHNVANSNSMREKDLLDIEFEKPKSPTIHIPPYSKRGRKRKLPIDRNNVQNIIFSTSDNLDINPSVKEEQIERYPDFIKNEVVDNVSTIITSRPSHSMSTIVIDKPDGSEADKDEEEEENMTKYKRKETPTSSKRKLFEEISKKIIQNQVPNIDNKETKDKLKEVNNEENNDDEDEDEEDVCLTVVEEEELVEKMDNRFDSMNQLDEEIERCEHEEVDGEDDEDYEEEEGNYDKEDSREILRRAEHNMVERRRRDRINGYIAELHKILPRPQRNSVGHSKGAILKAVFDHYRNQCDTYRLLKEKCRTLVDKCVDKDNRIQQLEKEKSLLCKKLNFINETVTATLFKAQGPDE